MSKPHFPQSSLTWHLASKQAAGLCSGSAGENTKRRSVGAVPSTTQLEHRSRHPAVQHGGKARRVRYQVHQLNRSLLLRLALALRGDTIYPDSVKRRLCPIQRSAPGIFRVAGSNPHVT